MISNEGEIKREDEMAVESGGGSKQGAPANPTRPRRETQADQSMKPEQSEQSEQ